MFIESSMASSESQNIRKSSVPSVKRTLSWSYWCRQKSRTVCRRNVQLLMPTLFLKRTKIWQQKNGKLVRNIWQLDTVNSSISTTPLRFDDAPARNAFKYLQMILYCQKLEPLTYIFNTDSVGLSLLLFTQLSLNVEHSESITASTETEFYMK